jgi:outer membrane biosynthesis protein TonB
VQQTFDFQVDLRGSLPLISSKVRSSLTTMATHTLSAMIDPTKQAEYPIVLGERLSQNADTSRLVNINYNYKSKSATPQQRSTITHSQSSDLYDLAVTDKAPNADHTLTYSYKGSEDPSTEQSLVLIFDPERKVFVLEPVSTSLNFNLRSAPGKTEKQVREQYEQLQIKEEDEPTTSGEDRHAAGSTSEDEGPADDSNPYDYRHFLPKNRKEEDKPISGHTTPEPTPSRADTPLMPASRPAPKPAPRPKAQANPLRQKKPTKPQPKPQPQPERVSQPDPPEHEDPRSSPSDAGTGSQQTGVQSPGSNIIVDGDLIIDMGSPPPSRSFVVNPAYFSSNNTPADDDGDEDIGEFSLPSPAGNNPPTASSTHTGTATQEDEIEDDDALAAEMEAAFEQSAREEEARHQYSQPSTRQYVPSDDESEVSEEE